MLKRTYDLFFSALGLLLLSPLLATIALIVRITSGSPVFFSQCRVGHQGRLFSILKFRTMVPKAEQLGASVTGAGDSRVTRVGRFLRRTKLDELPQLWNVLVGDMSLVGPRPEVPRYVEYYTPLQQRVLALKPGITDLATLLYRDEEDLLRDQVNVERAYIREIMPRKIELNLAYAAQANLWEDTKIILCTLIPGFPFRARAEMNTPIELTPIAHGFVRETVPKV